MLALLGTGLCFNATTGKKHEVDVPIKLSDVPIGYNLVITRNNETIRGVMTANGVIAVQPFGPERSSGIVSGYDQCYLYNCANDICSGSFVRWCKYYEFQDIKTVREEGSRWHAVVLENSWPISCNTGGSGMSFGNTFAYKIGVQATGGTKWVEETIEKATGGLSINFEYSWQVTFTSNHLCGQHRGPAYVAGLPFIDMKYGLLHIYETTDRWGNTQYIETVDTNFQVMVPLNRKPMLALCAGTEPSYGRNFDRVCDVISDPSTSTGSGKTLVENWMTCDPSTNYCNNGYTCCYAPGEVGIKHTCRSSGYCA